MSLYDGCAVLYIHTFLPAHPSRLRRATTTTPVQRQLLCSRGCPIPVLQRRNRVAYSSSWSVIHFIVIAKLLLVQNNQNGQSSRRCAPDLGGSVAHLHLKGAPIIDMGETPQVAAAGTLVTMSPRSRQAPPLSITGGGGALVRRLRVRTAAHLRVSTSANVVSKKRGMLARQYRRSSENGDYWRLEPLYFVALTVCCGCRVALVRPPLKMSYAGRTPLKKGHMIV